MLDLVDRRHDSAVVDHTHDLTWLLPGGAPGHPISASQLTRRLRQLDIRARHTTLMDLAAQLPASVLADLLGLRATTATRWTQLAGNTRPLYTAEVSRRKT